MLATDHSQLKDHYDVLIVGSGYGGAIAAARLGYANSKSGSKLSIAILERGIEWPTGSLPVTATEFARSLKTGSQPLGLFEFVVSSDFDVVQGSGLGGTSLVNGCVCIIPDREVFEASWPKAIAAEDRPMGVFYDRALAMLDAVPYADLVELPKVGVFRQMSQAVGSNSKALTISITTKPRTTRYGIPRRPCVNCGSCISGCNYESKNTLDKNYLPMARHFGVEMFTRMEVDSFRKLPDGTGYQVSVMHRLGQDGTDIEWRTISARRLILAAGCLGTTAIMLRSQSPTLEFSKQLGQHFSGNGDYFALAYNGSPQVNFNGWGVGSAQEFQIRNGPTITSFFKLNQGQPLNQRMTFEEASMPAPFVETMRNLGFIAAAGQPWSFLNSARKIQRWLSDRVRSNDGAINHSLLFLGMGFDTAAGVISLRPNGSVRIDWPNAGDDPVFKLLEPVTVEMSKAVGGNQLPQPLLAFIDTPITGHPIGGCATADDMDKGVVNDRGQVFNPDGGVYEGLYIVDGSIFPGSIGVNVLLTISAFSERAADFMRKEIGLPPFNKADEWDDKV